MLNCLKLEFKRAITSKSFYIAIIIGTVFPAIGISPFLGNKYWYGWSEVWIQSVAGFQGVFSGFFPLIAAIPYGDTLAIERKNHLFKYICTRENKNTYILSKGIVNGIMGGLSLLIPIIILSIIIIFQFPTVTEYDDVIRFGPKTPELFILTFCIWTFFQGVVWATFSYMISLIKSNSIIVLALPFLYFSIVQVIFSLIDLQRVTPASSFAPYSMQNLTIFDVFVHIIVLIVLYIILAIYYKKNKVECYE